MTKDEIIALAKEAGVLDVHSANVYMCSQSELFRFVNAIQAKERERCAKVIEDDHFLHDQSPAKLFADQAAKAIRGLE